METVQIIITDFICLVELVGGCFEKCAVLLFFEEKILPTINLDCVVSCYIGLLWMPVLLLVWVI